MLSDTHHIRSRLDILYLVTREFSAPLDIDQVLQRVLAATVAAVGAYNASLLLFSPEGRVEHSLRINRFEVQNLSQATIDLISSQGLVAWIKDYRQGVLIKDTQADSRWLPDTANPELHPARSAIAVPIHLPDQFIGVITITAAEPDFFGEDDLSMLSVIADQAAFAITNARLFKAEQHRRRLADTLASVARTLNSTLDLKKVLDLILEQLGRVIEYDSSAILLFEGETLVVRAARGFENIQDVLRVKIPVDRAVPNHRVVIEKKPVLINDVETESGWLKDSTSEKIRSWIGVPLIAQDKVVGMLTIDSYQVNKYTPDNLGDVAAFADQAATAVVNAQTVAMLRGMEVSYTDLFEDSADLIVITNYPGIILNVNRKACQMLHLTKEALTGSELSSIDRRLADCLQKNAKRLQSWREVLLELDVVNTYQETISLEVHARHVQYGGKPCVQWIGRDISARKESEKMRQDLLNMLVHDLRGPIGNLINTIELLPMLLGTLVTDKNPKINRFLELARRSGQEVRDLVDSMLDVGRLEGSEIYLQQSRVDLNEIVQAVQDQVTQRAMSKKTELIINPLPDNLPEIWLDGSMIRRVLINLVDNAIKYTPHQGQVSLTTTINPNTLRFAISDNGPGIGNADRERIFKKFSRVDHSTHAPSGVGLGLAFCKLAVEAHNGQIWVESEGVPGKGSTFYVTIPLVSPPEEE